MVSRGAGENLRSLGYQGEYIVMENGVDFPRGRVPQEETEALRRELGIPRETPVYLFVGRLMWYKGIRIILDALKRQQAAGNDFRMVIVGDGMEREEIEAYAAELGLGDLCRFTGAIRDREKLRTFFSMADLFLFPSTFDTNGIVVREAAACGLASVLIRGSCAAEGVAHGQNALLIQENTQALSALLSGPGRDRAALRRMGDRAMEELYLSWDDSVRMAYRRYGAVLENYRRGITDRSVEWSDDFYSVMGELCLGIERARALRSSLRQRMRERTAFRE